ncbi:hypothetical protein STEG23_014043 [Scotinomys teguina]
MGSRFRTDRSPFSTVGRFLGSAAAGGKVLRGCPGGCDCCERLSANNGIQRRKTKHLFLGVVLTVCVCCVYTSVGKHPKLTISGSRATDFFELTLYPATLLKVFISYRKKVPWDAEKKQKDGPCFRIHSVSLCLFIGFLYLDGYFLIYFRKIFFNDFIEYVFCAFELVFFSFYSYYLKFIYMVYYIDRLSYVEPSLHLWDKAYLVMVDNVFDVFLESVCQYFIEYFCIYVHEGDCHYISIFISNFIDLDALSLCFALSLIISSHLFLLGEFASSCSRAFSFDLVDLSIGESGELKSPTINVWDLMDDVGIFPSSAFCKAGFVDRYCLNLVLPWNVLFTPSIVIESFAG